MAPRIVVVGSSNTDLVVRCSRLPAPGETLLGGKFAQFAGGKGANQAVAAARAGAQVTFVGAHGNDDFGRAAKAGLRREGIDVRHFRCVDAPSGIALILVGGKTGENLIAVASSANSLVSPDFVAKASTAFRKAAAVVCQLEIPLETIEAAAKLAAANDVPFILNPAPAQRLPKRLLKLVHTLVPNETEVELLSEVKQPCQAARRLIELGCQNVVVTLGAQGAMLVTADSEQPLAASRVKPVDSVGAGDCFTAWYAVGVAKHLSPLVAAQRAVAAATVMVTRAGAQAAMPYRKEIVAGSS